MICGLLVYDCETDRLDIVSEEGCRTGGLHCGDCITVWADGAWRSCRVEYERDWYLDGLYREGVIPCGLQARFQ